MVHTQPVVGLSDPVLTLRVECVTACFCLCCGGPQFVKGGLVRAWTRLGLELRKGIVYRDCQSLWLLEAAKIYPVFFQADFDIYLRKYKTQSNFSIFLNKHVCDTTDCLLLKKHGQHVSVTVVTMCIL